ncbi:MAG: hypothetical protein UU58_C0008G0010 [Candidatus Nomurabacteria bacterium GW2011_GWA2_41_25]|uniref:Uncharacterized protein n=2 Tax=Candidatus Nomuraibacteriota TaxID=1752729 RepID=A0A1F6YC05_9BACT|nr:MAG: hypothetical protein UU58_C0008G0010 [Candidatus Nomurabacteria bacterium GW2011_GWA2_41_25]OGI66718.1 MAG: hypothetical protein A2823_00780 [Candidatus Nomurabacteria bacterium RIFCSPHIGHO2_01_FULL_41_91]OGI80360.1 MAG: hypothetical protein A3D43_02145 [Candidatus Nomurabacteria bacterium RIFCSPHIGHO2_02_FULL_41_52]OGI85329.1 MAG: hypothetical protein A3F49_01365 [Candidatus Nomurabacteria bacterium RIFCSPHIGHO2_12_FULL_42_19]OGI93516.1 MAG: hypothetical protein A3A07_01615 [Candidatus
MSKKIWIFSIVATLFCVLVLNVSGFFGDDVYYKKPEEEKKLTEKNLPLPIPPLDIIAYDKKINEIANNPLPKEPVKKIIKDPKTGEETTITIEPKPTPSSPWPVKTPYPNPGAILPFKRIVAYYGNLYSTKMGVLGQYPEEEMLVKLGAEVKKWEEADPDTPVVPALHYIAVVAQNKPGDDGKYRFRMPYSEIDKVLAMAAKIPARNASGTADAGGNAIVFLDIQLGFSSVEKEIPLLEKYFKMPNVHLGIDPEFSMKSGIRPGKIVGTLDATDINFALNYLAGLVRGNNLTPKILTIHRYTQKMVTNYKQIKTLPEVQIVMHMDGWGGEAKKINTYQQFIYKEPVQFTGFKLFYKNDTLGPGTLLMTPEKLLKLSPRPIYIQYQ